MPDTDGANAPAFLLKLPMPESDFRSDVFAGLSAMPKSLPPKYFYDAKGAKLFEAICETPEYYPTRTETALLEAVAGEIAARAGPGASLFEPGSGAATKARRLLPHFEDPAEYILIDISVGQLQRVGAEIAAALPNLRVGLVAADFTAAMPGATDIFTGQGRRVCFFPGSTLGNFDPAGQRELLRNFRSLLRPGDAVLIGLDTVKPAARLNAAYNDAAGLTAEFNLNVLARLKAELGAELDLDAFTHHAFYNAAEARIEMHLRASRATEIVVDGQVFAFAAGETLHTENSYKFDSGRLRVLASDVGLTVQTVWTAPQDDFLLAWLSV